MPGLSGIIQKEKPINSPQNYICAFDLVHHINGVTYEKRAFSSNRAVIHNLMTGHIKSTLTQPAKDRDDRFILMIEGDVVNEDYLRKKVPNSDDLDLCQLILACYLNEGDNFVKSVEGIFNIVIYDQKDNVLKIYNDPFGSKSMSYKQEGETLLFASEKKSILAVQSDSSVLDPVGLLQVFVHIHNVGGKSFLKNVKSLPSGTCLTFKDGKVTLTPTKRLKAYQVKMPKSEKEIIEQWSELLKKAVNIHVKNKEKVCMQLSGGLDSRALAVALSRELRPFTSITRGKESQVEVQCAKQVAEGLLFNFIQFESSNELKHSHIPAICWRAECAVGFNHSNSISTHNDFIQHADFIMGGQFGGICGGGNIYPEFFKKIDREYFIKMFFNKYSVSKNILREVFTSRFYNKYYDEVQKEFSNSFESINEEENVQLMQVWDQSERHYNHVLRAGLVDSHLFEKVYPFLDWNFTEFSYSINPRMLVNKDLYRSVVYHLGPEIRHVPYANDFLKLQSSILKNKMNRMVKKRYWKLIRDFKGLFKEKVQILDKQAINEQMTQQVERFLKSDIFDSQVFDREGIKRLLINQKSLDPKDKESAVVLINTLVTFAEGLPIFLYNPVKSIPDSAHQVLDRS